MTKTITLPVDQLEAFVDSTLNMLKLFQRKEINAQLKIDDLLVLADLAMSAHILGSCAAEPEERQAQPEQSGKFVSVPSEMIDELDKAFSKLNFGNCTGLPKHVNIALGTASGFVACAKHYRGDENPLGKLHPLETAIILSKKDELDTPIKRKIYRLVKAKIQ